MITRQKFIYSYFRNNQTVDYLKTCDLTYDDREKIFGMVSLGSIDEQCMKYIIDCYGNRTFDWAETFKNFDGFSRCSPLRIICFYCTEEIILYMLDVYERCDLETKFTEGVDSSIIRSSLLSIVCHCITHNWSGQRLASHVMNCTRIMNRTLDIYIKKNLCLDVEYGHNEIMMGSVGRSFVCLVLLWNNPQIIKRVLDICVVRQIDFDDMTLGGVRNCCMRGENCMYKYLMCTEKEVFG